MDLDVSSKYYNAFQSFILVSPKFQKRSALKLAGRTIPEAERSGIRVPNFSETPIPKAKRVGFGKLNYPTCKAMWDRNYARSGVGSNTQTPINFLIKSLGADNLSGRVERAHYTA